jgi:hypothetical protein
MNTLLYIFSRDKEGWESTADKEDRKSWSKNHCIDDFLYFGSASLHQASRTMMYYA